MNQTLSDPNLTCPACQAVARQGARFCARCGTSVWWPHNESVKDCVPAEHGRYTSEIAFKEVESADRILIETTNSTYRFAVTDARRRRGLLSGGPLASRLEDATLIGVLVKNNSGFQSDTSGLRTDSFALFFIREEDGFRRLTTSLITSLVHIKGDEARTTQLY